MDEEIRASDAEREDVLARLGQAVGEGRLDLELYSERSASVVDARTRGELAALTADLPATRPSPVAPAGRIAVFLGNASRKGVWDVPERLAVRSVLGDCHIELQQARLTHPVTTIEATAVLGAITIFVPPGIDVRMAGTAVLAERSVDVRGEVPPGAPILVVEGRAYLSSVSVRTSRGW